MANLIQVQNDLKNLSDEELQAATQSPSEGMPPFMVLAETQRRQSMRDAYEGERARQQENQTTVAEDLTGAAPPPQGLPGGPPPVPGGPPPGLGAPAPGGLPPSGPPPGMPAFANGGLVDFGADYRQGLAALAQQQAAQRTDLKNMALLNAGLRIMGGSSPYAAQNISQAAPAVAEYQQGLQRSMQDQLGLMRAGAEFDQAERAATLQQMQFDFRQKEAARRAAVDERRLDIQEQAANKPIADIQRYEYRASLPPEEQEKFDKTYLATRGLSPEQTDRYMSAAYTAAEKEAYKQVLNDPTMLARMSTPDGKAEVETAVQAMARDIFARRNPQWAPFANRFGGGASAAPPVTPGGVTIVDTPPPGSTIQPLVDPLVYGGD